jgi:hypothetical protein
LLNSYRMGCEDVRVNTLMNYENEIISREGLTHFNLDFSPDACLTMTSETRRWCAQEIIMSLCFIRWPRKRKRIEIIIRAPTTSPKPRCTLQGPNLALSRAPPGWCDDRLQTEMKLLEGSTLFLRRDDDGKMNKAQIMITGIPPQSQGLRFWRTPRLARVSSANQGLTGNCGLREEVGVIKSLKNLRFIEVYSWLYSVASEQILGYLATIYSLHSLWNLLYYISMALQPLWALAVFCTQSIGLLGRGISPSQGRYLHTEQHKHRINAHRHACLKWDSNPRSQCSSGRRRFMLRSRGHCDRKCIVHRHQIILNYTALANDGVDN